MYIGNVKLNNNVFLAPMAGITDLPFRTLCREQGCGLVYSEMVSAKGIMYNNENTHKLLEVAPEERPVAVQLFGSDPDILGAMAKKIEDTDIDILDINMGCPAPKIVKNHEGSALMKRPELIGDIVYAVSHSQKKPVTIKIRKGFDDTCINAVEIAKIAEANGAAAIAVHGRTREQYYSGKAEWDIIKEVKKAVKNIPVIGNGDIVDALSAKAIIDYTGCDAIMIGRASQGNPWIFRQVVTYLETGELLPEPTPEEKSIMAKRHARMLIDYKGEYIGVREMRRHLTYYTRGIKNAAAIRGLVNTAKDEKELMDIIDTYFV